jgi:cytochrome c6
MTRRITILVLLTAAFALRAVAQDSSAKDLFVSKCAICHGPDGSAKTTMGKNLKIRDFHSSDVQKQSDADLKAIIMNGKKKMPSFKEKLSGEQVDELVAHIRTIGKQQ